MATWMAVALVLMTLATPSTYGLVLEGSHTSYAQFRQWHGGHNDSLTFEFSTNQSDALLLYSDNNQEKEYLQIKLVDGNVMLRYVLLFFCTAKRKLERLPFSTSSTFVKILSASP